MDLFFWIALFIVLSSVKDIKKRLKEKLEEANREMEGNSPADSSSSGTPMTDAMSDLRGEIRRRIEQKRAQEAMEQNRAPAPMADDEAEVFHSEPHHRTAPAPVRPHLPEGQADPFHNHERARSEPRTQETTPPSAWLMENGEIFPHVIDIPPMPVKPVSVGAPSFPKPKAKAIKTASVYGTSRVGGKGSFAKLKRRLRSGKGLQEAFVLNEIVSKPKSMRRESQSV